jgi:KaiC/GvpD/RAD55 family RecA-like ATPase
MSNEFLQEIMNNKFVMVLMQEKEYMRKLSEIVNSVKRENNKICYVCLSKPYRDVLEELRKHSIDTGNFFFIDVLSSHYGRPEPTRNCIFLNSPSDLDALKMAITRVIEDKLCTVVLFDTISTLLIYQQTHSIVKFTHSLTIEKTQ